MVITEYSVRRHFGRHQQAVHLSAPGQADLKKQGQTRFFKSSLSQLIQLKITITELTDMKTILSLRICDYDIGSGLESQCASAA